MAGRFPHCTLVPDVTGVPRLTPIQRRFLRLFLAGDPGRLRVNWLDQNGRVICRVAQPFAYHPAACRIQAYRLAGDDECTFRGDSINHCAPSVDDLRALEDCWTVPLNTLSPLGIELANAPAPPPPVVMTFKASPDFDRAVKQRAQAEGRTATAVIQTAVSLYLRGAQP